MVLSTLDFDALFNADVRKMYYNESVEPDIIEEYLEFHL